MRCDSRVRLRSSLAGFRLSAFFANTMFDGLCKQTHETMLAGTCPWCGEEIFEGRAIRKGYLRSAEELDRVQKSGLTELGDDWFNAKLASAKRKDRNALLLLHGSCMEYIMGIGQELTAEHPAILPADALKEAHLGFTGILRRYQGSKVDEFLAYLKDEIVWRLDQTFGQAE